MNIAFVAHHAWPSVGGAESFLRHLTRAMACRHDVRVVTLSIASETPHRLGESLPPASGFAPFTDGGVRTEHLALPLVRRALLAPFAGQVVPGLRRYACVGGVRRSYGRRCAHVVAPVVAARCAGAAVVHMWGIGSLGAASERAARLLRVPTAIAPSAHRGHVAQPERLRAPGQQGFASWSARFTPAAVAAAGSDRDRDSVMAFSASHGVAS